MAGCNLGHYRHGGNRSSDDHRQQDPVLSGRSCVEGATVKFLRFLWEWTPPDIWENPPAFLTRWQESLFLWIGRQVSEVVKMLGSLLLSFPTHFIETPG